MKCLVATSDGMVREFLWEWLGTQDDIILAKSLEVLRADFPELAPKISVALPDEKSRRVGQSIAAASLPTF